MVRPFYLTGSVGLGSSGYMGSVSYQLSLEYHNIAIYQTFRPLEVQRQQFVNDGKRENYGNQKQ